jgi:hypothetical protein
VPDGVRDFLLALDAPPPVLKKRSVRGLHGVIHVIENPPVAGGRGGGRCARTTRFRNHLTDDGFDQLLELMLSDFHRIPRSVISSISFPL